MRKIMSGLCGDESEIDDGVEKRVSEPAGSHTYPAIHVSPKNIIARPRLYLIVNCDPDHTEFRQQRQENENSKDDEMELN